MEESSLMWWPLALVFNLPQVALVGGVQWMELRCLLLECLELLRLCDSTFVKVSSMVGTEDLGKALTQAEVLSKQS